MSVRSEAAELVRSAAEPRKVGDSVKKAVGRASKRLGFGFNRTRDIWYRRARRIDAEEMDALRRAAGNQAERYERIARAMEQTDQDFYGQDIVALVESAKRLRGMGGAGT